jgi:hypothetical protein
MNNTILAFMPVLCLIAVWLLISQVIRRLANFKYSDELHELERLSIDNSGWTSAAIGFIRLNNCITIYRTNGGYIIKLMKILGGGYKYFEDHNVISVDEHKWLFMKVSQATIITNNETIKILGRGAVFIKRYLQPRSV